MMRRGWTLALLAALPAGPPLNADTGRHVVTPCVVALVYVEENGKRFIDVLGASGGAVRYRKRLGEAKYVGYAFDRTRVSVTDSALGALVCLDRATGRELWRRACESGPDEWEGLEFAGTRLIVSSGKGTRVLVAATGAVARELGSSWCGSSRDGRTLLVQEPAGRVTALDAATLETLWTRTLADQQRASFAGDEVLLQTDQLRLVEARTGRERVRLGVERLTGASVWVVPGAGGYLCTVDSRSLHGLTREGAVKWTLALEDQESLWGAEGDHAMVYTWKAPFRFRVIALSSGRVEWDGVYRAYEWSLRTSPNSSSGVTVWCAQGPETIWAADAERGELAVHDLATGRLRATVRPGDSVLDLSRERDRVVVLTKSALRGYDARSGLELWSVRLSATAVAGHLIAAADER